jgi:tRNA threonylcarbamoyladenosine biosynthesis protein TsaB
MILSIETATDLCGAALVHKGQVIAVESIVEKKIHSEKLLPMIDALLRSASTGLKAVDAIAVSIGPGSFTGLRIGLSTAKGLAIARQKPIVAVPTLDAMAFEYFRSRKKPDDEIICPLVDAKRDEAYFCFYTANLSGIIRSTPYEIAGIAKIASAAAAFGAVTFIGDGIAKMEAAEKTNGLFGFVLESVCSPAAVGLVAEREGRRLTTSEFAMLEPMYIREFVATKPGARRPQKPQRAPVELSQKIQSTED